MVTDVYSTIQPGIKNIDDPNRNEGETQLISKGSKGYRVKVYRKTFENSKLINTELISTDTYNAVPEEIIRGTKKLTVELEQVGNIE